MGKNIAYFPQVKPSGVVSLAPMSLGENKIFPHCIHFFSFFNMACAFDHGRYIAINLFQLVTQSNKFGSLSLVGVRTAFFCLILGCGFQRTREGNLSCAVFPRSGA